MGMIYSRIPIENKLRLIRAYRAELDYLALADQLEIKRSTARNIVAKAMRLDDPESFTVRPRGGARNVKVDDEVRALIADILGDEPSISVSSLNQEIRRRLPAKRSISETNIRRVCNGMFYTIRTPPRPVPPPSAAADCRRLRDSLLAAHQRLVFVDALAFNVWLQRCRGTPGAVVARKVCGQRGEGKSLLVAVSARRGVEGRCVVQGRVSRTVVAEFVSGVAAAAQEPSLFLMEPSLAHDGLQLHSPLHQVRLLPAALPDRCRSPAAAALEAWRGRMKARVGTAEMQQRLTKPGRDGNCGSLLQLLRALAFECLDAVAPEQVGEWQLDFFDALA